MSEVPKSDEPAIEQPRSIRDLVENFQARVQEAVIMANVLSQEMSSMQTDLQQAVIGDNKDDGDVEPLFSALNETAEMVVQFTGQLEREIDRFICTAREEILTVAQKVGGPSGEDPNAQDLSD